MPRSRPRSRPRRRIRLFVPIIAGATLGDRLLACIGALIGIGVTATASALLLGFDPALPAIVAPMGASAVLVFAVPASPLAQPWPVIGGNTISAIVGVAVAQAVEPPALAAALGVCLAILAMSFTRSLHPPGGAAALTAVIGGQTVAELGFRFALLPVALNAVLLVLVGYVFHRLARRRYPHVPVAAPAGPHGTVDPPPRLRAGIRGEDVDAALETVGESFDIDRKDLERITAEAGWHASLRAPGGPSAADIMSRDVVRIGRDAGADEARALLVRHNVRTLPVVDGGERLVGMVGLRQLLDGGAGVASVMTAPVTAAPGDPVTALLPPLTDGTTHGVVIVDAERRVQGLVTQTDLLAAIARMRVAGPAAASGISGR